MIDYNEMFVCVNKENSILGCVAMSKHSPDDTSIELRRMRVARRARGIFYTILTVPSLKSESI